jgi:hypothetical protein
MERTVSQGYVRSNFDGALIESPSAKCHNQESYISHGHDD